MIAPSHTTGTRFRRGARAFSAVLVLALVLVLAFAALGCGGTSDEAATTDEGGTRVDGGVLKVGHQAGNGQYDPLLMAGATGDILLVCQVQENLVDLSQEFTVVPWLAKEWDSADGQTWKVTLNEGVVFTNGEAFTSDDVVYSFDRLRSEELGSPMADVYSNIKSVVADDPTHVTFNLKTPDSEFLASLTDYRAMMLCKSVKDPMTETRRHRSLHA